jgi:hypothetical protein
MDPGRSTDRAERGRLTARLAQNRRGLRPNTATERLVEQRSRPLASGRNRYAAPGLARCFEAGRTTAFGGAVGLLATQGAARQGITAEAARAEHWFVTTLIAAARATRGVLLRNQVDHAVPTRSALFRTVAIVQDRRRPVAPANSVLIPRRIEIRMRRTDLNEIIAGYAAHTRLPGRAELFATGKSRVHTGLTRLARAAAIGCAALARGRTSATRLSTRAARDPARGARRSTGWAGSTGRAPARASTSTTSSARRAARRTRFRPLPVLTLVGLARLSQPAETVAGGATRDAGRHAARAGKLRVSEGAGRHHGAAGDVLGAPRSRDTPAALIRGGLRRPTTRRVLAKGRALATRVHRRRGFRATVRSGLLTAVRARAAAGYRPQREHDPAKYPGHRGSV